MYCAQTKKFIRTIRGLVENLLANDDSEVLEEGLAFDYTLNDAEELIQGVKQLAQCSDYAEQSGLLPLAPPS